MDVQPNVPPKVHGPLPYRQTGSPGRRDTTEYSGDRPDWSVGELIDEFGGTVDRFEQCTDVRLGATQRLERRDADQ